MATTKFYLTIQWKHRLPRFERLVELDKLIENEVRKTGLEADFDGNDIGADECNLFIGADDPEGVFKIARGVIERSGESTGMSAAYRLSYGEDYVILWPPGLTHFDVS